MEELNKRLKAINKGTKIRWFEIAGTILGGALRGRGHHRHRRRGGSRDAGGSPTRCSRRRATRRVT